MRNKTNIILVTFTLIGLLSIIPFLSNQSFGIDESFSLYASSGWQHMARTLWNQEANMWLYYFILHYWQLLGRSEFVVRSLSLLFAALTIPVIIKIGERMFNRRVGLIAGLLTSVNIFFVLYAQMARSYSLSLFLVSLSSYLFLRLSDGKKYQILYILTSALSVYAHFYSGLVLFAQFVTLIIQRKWRDLTNFFIIALLILPLVLAPSFKSNQIDWIVKPNLTSLVGTAFVLSGDMPFLFLIYSLLFLSLISKLKDAKYTFLISWLMFPVLVSFIFSLLVKPIYQSVYFITLLPPFILLASHAIDRLSKNSQRITLGLIIFFSVVRLFLWHSQNTRIKWVISNKFVDWRGATGYITANSYKSDISIFYGYYGRLPYITYGFANTPPVIEISSLPYNVGGGDRSPDPDLKLISGFAYPRVWVVLHRPYLDSYNHQATWDNIVSALEKNYHLNKKQEFEGLDIVLFTSK